MPSQKRQFGDIGEKEAEIFLINKGYRVIDKNYRVKNIGEIDLIGKKKDKLYFFEVKTRDVKHETNFPIGFSINEKKRRNLNKICHTYLADKRLPASQKWQVDAVFVKVNFQSRDNQIEHMENILWENYY